MTDPLTRLQAPPAPEQPAPDFVRSLKDRILRIEGRDRRRAPAQWHLAQLNLGRFKAPLDAPEMQPFAVALDRINELAERSPGFVWRLTDDDGGPSSNVEVPGVDDPLMASNLTVWTDLESLRDFMYRTDHMSYLRRRSEWFQHEEQAMVVAWWIPAGTVPTLEDAVRRLDHLRDQGPSDVGFPLTRRIPPPPTEPTSEEATVSGQVFIPYLTVGDSRAALEFYAEVFDAEQHGEPFEMDDGRIGHVEMTVDGQLLYMADEFPEMNLHQPKTQGSNSVGIVINVDDCDEVYDAVLGAGGTGERPPADQHGFRIAWVVDPWGHRWSLMSAEKGDR